MSFVKGALLATTFAVLATVPAKAEFMENNRAMILMSDGQYKSVQVTKLPKGAKLMKHNMGVVMMNGKMYLVDMASQNSLN